MKEEFQKEKVLLGLMRLEKISVDELSTLIGECLKLGIHYFDISDVYCRNLAESKLGEVLKLHPEFRKQMFIQSKCGILKDENRKTTMDLSYRHIKEACYASLKRMNLEYMDCFLLHRVDIFMDNKEISKALNELYQEGKIMHIGVSNMDGSIIDYLQEELLLPIELDQLQVSLGQPGLLSEAFNINFPGQVPNIHTGLFFYLKRKGITLQCWSPYQYGFFEGSIFDKERFPKLNEKLDELAKKYHSTPCGIATSFLTMLTEDCQVITGSMNIDHIKETFQGSKIVMEKKDWYDLYCSTGNLLP